MHSVVLTANLIASTQADVLKNSNYELQDIVRVIDMPILHSFTTI